jgi:hypothetical protein
MIEKLAKDAYERFSVSTRLHRDVGLAWTELPEMVREAWMGVVKAVVERARHYPAREMEGFWCQNCSRVPVDRQGGVCNPCKSLFGVEV